MYIPREICAVNENANGHLDVAFENPNAFSPEFLPETSEFLNDLVSSTSSDILLNLSGIEFISSEGLNLLLEIRHVCEENHMSFGLVHVAQPIRDVFRVTKLERLFLISPVGEICRR